MWQPRLPSKSEIFPETKGIFSYEVARKGSGGTPGNVDDLDEVESFDLGNKRVFLNRFPLPTSTDCATWRGRIL